MRLVKGVEEEGREGGGRGVGEEGASRGLSCKYPYLVALRFQAAGNMRGRGLVVGADHYGRCVASVFIYSRKYGAAACKLMQVAATTLGKGRR